MIFNAESGRNVGAEDRAAEKEAQLIATKKTATVGVSGPSLRT